MILHVEVTEADIAAGVRRDCSRCPVALGLARAGHAVGFRPRSRLGEFVWIEGGYFHVGRHHGRLPDPVIAFVEDLDRGEHVAPLAFDLDFPDLTLGPDGEDGPGRHPGGPPANDGG